MKSQSQGRSARVRTGKTLNNKLMNLRKIVRPFTVLALVATSKTAMKTAFLLALACVGPALALRADLVIQFDDLPSNLSHVPNG